MIEGELTVLNRAGLHTRPSATLVKLTAKYKCDITIIRNGFAINGKSIIGVMTLAAEQGAKLTLKCDGPDQEEAFAAIKALFDDAFGEIM
ncbi:MAG: HPr family phosphocarrier protein [Candidatus Kapaibacteriales bacterium]